MTLKEQKQKYVKNELEICFDDMKYINEILYNHFFKIYFANSYIPITTPSSKPIINQKFSLSLYLSNQYPPNPNKANAPKI